MLQFLVQFRNAVLPVTMAKITDYILLFFVVVLYLLSKIGDALIWIIKYPFKTLTQLKLKPQETREAKVDTQNQIFARNTQAPYQNFTTIQKESHINKWLITYNYITKRLKKLLNHVGNSLLGYTFIASKSIGKVLAKIALTILLIIQDIGYLTRKIISLILNLVLLPFKTLYKFTTRNSRTQLQFSEVKPRHYKKRFRFSYYSFILGIITSIFFIFIPYNFYLFLKSLPNPQELSVNHYPATTQIFDRNGVLLYEIYADENRIPIKLEEVPLQVINATIAIEDKEFYYHPGFSTRGIVRSLREILVHRKLQGGSTITQQLIKSALLTPERTVQRKIKEIVLAFWAERLYTKEQILEMYLNQVPYGGTAWGIQAAAQTYFGKNIQDVTLAESALLAGLPAAPTYYSPFGAHPELAVARKNQVLEELYRSGKTNKEEYENALKEELRFVPQITNIKAPHFVMYIKTLLEQKYGLRRVEQGGLRVTTSLDITIQDKVQEIVKNQIDDLSALLVGNGAAVVANPKTGEVLALVGSKNYFDIKSEGNVNITTSLQQPGSSIKVVTYATALENGFTAASIIDDSPISYSLPNQAPYQPVNYDGKFHGKVTLRKALGNSYNIPAVKTLAAVGLDKMISYGRRMGIESWNETSRFGLSLTLGGGEITMLDMTSVYNTMADSGNYKELNPILKVSTLEGHILEEATVIKKPALKPETAYILATILSDDGARTDAFGPNSKLVIPGKTVAVKTGTSNDKRDNWTIGYTPSYTVTVWVGNNNNTPMHPTLTSGVTGATPIWNEIMTYLTKNKEDEPFAKPPSIISLPCYGRIEFFVTGTQPLGGCPTIPPPTPTTTKTP